MFFHRGFWPLFFAVSFGTFGDYYFKSAMVTFVTFQYNSGLPIDRNVIVLLVPALLITPFVLFAYLSGNLADLIPKATLLKWNRLFGASVLIIGSWAMYYENLIAQILVIFLIGIEITLLNPLKLGILPFHFSANPLLKANSYLNLGTFLAVFIGTLLGNYSVTLQNAQTIIAITVAFCGLCSAFFAFFQPFSGEATANKYMCWNPFKGTINILQYNWRNLTIRKGVVSNSWFWFVSTYYFSFLPIMVRDGLRGDALVLNVILFAFSVGIALGSVVPTMIKKIRPLDSCKKALILGMIASVALGFLMLNHMRIFDHQTAEFLTLPHFLSSWNFWGIFALCFLVAAASGAYTVPLQTYIQESTNKEFIARTLAGANILDAAFMIVASVALLSLNELHVSPAYTVFIIALLLLISIFVLPIPSEKNSPIKT